jgi:hypothetical protein
MAILSLAVHSMAVARAVAMKSNRQTANAWTIPLTAKRKRGTKEAKSVGIIIAFSAKGFLGLVRTSN